MMKRALRWAVPLALAAVLIWWCFPRSLTPRREAVAEVHVSSGLTGGSFDSDDPLQVDEVLRALSGIKTVRTIPRLFGSGGYAHNLYFYDASGALLREVTLFTDETGCIGMAQVRVLGGEGLAEGLNALIETGSAESLLFIRAGDAAAKAAETDETVLAEYHGHEITRQAVTFWQTEHMLAGQDASEKQVVQDLLLKFMLDEAAEEAGLAPTPEEEAAFVASQKEAYEQSPEARAMIDTYCERAGLTLDAHWARVEEMAYGTLARAALQEQFYETYRAEHAAELAPLDDAARREAEASAWEAYGQALYESRKGEIVFH